VVNRDGETILDPEQELRLKQRQKGADIQVISPQNAYIMTDILLNSTRMGTLASGTQYGTKLVYKDEDGTNRTVPIAGKTGTTQNWSNAWAVAYTPNLSTAIWFGFDKPGESLGTSLTGATLAGPAIGDFMRIANEDYPHKTFVKPQSGLARLTVCSVSGNLPTAACGKNTTNQYFLKGTQPTHTCELHINRQEASNTGVERLASESFYVDLQPEEVSEDEIMVDLSFLDEFTLDSIEKVQKPKKGKQSKDEDKDSKIEDEISDPSAIEENFLFE
jgi:penicillin-binding protein 1A